MMEGEEAGRDEEALSSPPLPAPPPTDFTLASPPPPLPCSEAAESSPDNSLSRRSVLGGGDRSVSVASSRVRHLPEPGQTLVPEREPVRFDLDGLDTEEAMALEGLLKMLDAELWRWKNFPLTLPDPIIQGKADTLGAGPGKSLKLDDLFIVPDFDELEAVAAGPEGEEVRRLDEEQLEALRRTGEFEVPSEKFPGQKHRWRVTRLLIKGTDNTKKTFYWELSRALYLIVVTARNCVKGRTFSVMESVNGWSRGLMSLVDMLFGLPMLDRADVEHEIEKENSRYLVAELMCPPDRLLAFSRYLSAHGDDVRRRSHLRPLDVSGCPPAPVPHRFYTPQGLELDFQLFSGEVMGSGVLGKAEDRVCGILERFRTEWFPARRKEVLDELQERTKLREEEVRERAVEILQRESVNYVCEEVLKDDELRRLGERVPALLVEQFRTSLSINDSLSRFKEEVDLRAEECETELKASRPLLSQVRPWFVRRMRQAKAALSEESGGRAHEDAARTCGELGLNAGAYFLSRDLAFKKEREPVLRKELRKITRPSREIGFEANIWLPKNYVVKERLPGGREEEIPTVLRDDVDWKEEMDRCRDQGEKRHFELVKTRRWKVSSGSPCWRLMAFASHTGELLLNAFYFFGLMVPLVSPVSFPAVFRLDAFPAGYRLNYYNGELLPSSRKIETVYTLALKLQAHIRERREAFEERPDTMLLSKAMGRFFNRVHLYFLLGFFGHAFLVLVMPLGCILLSTLSLLLAVTSVVWVPVLCSAAYVLVILFYDYHGQRLLNGILWNVLVNIVLCGIVQPLVCSVVAFILCPLGALFVSAYASARLALREGYDAVTFATVLKRAARVPAAESFLAKRVAGPGMASKYFYQIKPEQALVALETRMEVEELDTYQRATARLACEPTENYAALMKKLLGPFGAQPSDAVAGPFQALKKEEYFILSNLSAQISVRKRNLEPKLTCAERERIRLSESDLRIVLQQASLMTKDFYPTRVFNRLTPTEKKRFWLDRGLSDGDWLGLACGLLAEYFSRDFLTPMQEADTVFSLEVKDWTLGRYMDLITKGRTREELDLAKVVYPRKEGVSGGNGLDPLTVEPPAFAAVQFNPRSRVGGLFQPPPTLGLETATTAMSGETGEKEAMLDFSGARGDTIKWRRRSVGHGQLWHAHGEEGLWRVRRRPPKPREGPLLRGSVEGNSGRLVLPHPAEVALLVLKKREDGGGGDAKAEKEKKSWDWWMVEDMGVALQELPWMPEESAAGAAAAAAAGDSDAHSDVPRRGSGGGGLDSSASSAGLSDALLEGEEGNGRRKKKSRRDSASSPKVGHTVVEIEMGEAQSRMAGKGSYPGSPV